MKKEHQEFADKIQPALDVAREVHRLEWRKGGKIPRPYFAHTQDLYDLAIKMGIEDVDVYKALILHDTVESGYDPGLIALQFPEVADYVKELTFIPSEDSNKKAQKEKYMESFANKSIVSVLVKVLDRICNVRDFINDNNVYAREYLQKAESLFDAFEDRKQEIIDRWGKDVWQKVKMECENIDYLTDYLT